MKVLDIVVTVLLVIAALSWGLVGLIDYNIITALFGEATAFTRIVYLLFGLSGIYEVLNFTVGYSAVHHRWCDYTSAKS